MEQTQMDVLKAKCRLRHPLMRKLLIEFVATTLLLYFGMTTDAQQTLNGWHLRSHVASALGWGLGLAFAVQISIRVSGAHLNPAVSFVVWFTGGMPCVHMLLYSLVQLAAGYMAALLTHLLYYEKIAEFRLANGDLAAAAIFATYPGAHLSIVGSIIDQISCSAMLFFCVWLIIDKRNGIPLGAQPAALGLMLTAICFGFALNAGNAMNPARDLGPRIYTLVAGFGVEVFSHRNFTWFWVPIACPYIGGLLGVSIYQFAVSAQLPPAEQEDTVKNAQEEKREENKSNCSSQKTLTELNIEAGLKN